MSDQPGPPANPSPLSTPDAGGFGDVLKYALPVIAAVAAGSNPALARGVGAFGGILNLQQEGAQRRQQMAHEQRLADLDLAERNGLLDYVKSLDPNNAPPDNANPASNPKMTGQGEDVGMGLTDDQTGSAAPMRLKQALSPLEQSYLTQARLAATGRDPSRAMSAIQDLMKYQARPTVDSINNLPTSPGTKFKIPLTREGYEAERSTPPTHFAARQNEVVIAPPGAKGPMGEDLSGKPALAEYDEGTGKILYVGEKSSKDYNRQPFEVALEALGPNATPEQKSALAAKYEVLGHPSAGYLPTAAGGLGMAKPNNAATGRADKSYQFSATQLNKMQDPIAQRLQRLSTLQDTINQRTPQADALIAPELLTVMAGGQGSGLRMNEAEISRIVGGRTNLESIKAALNKWQIDPSKGLSITPAQRQQIQGLVGTVNTKLQQKQSALEDAHAALIDTEDPAEHRRIVNEARKALSAVDTGPATATNAPSAPGAPAPVGMIINVKGKQQIKTENGWQPYSGQ